MAEQIVGITLAGCKIIKLIGKGGMGSVYLARQIDLGRFVAIKVLSKNLIQEEGFLRRFKREARAVASLSHPNIVSVHQYGDEDGIHFIVMEYVDGETIGGKLAKSGSLDEAVAIRYAKESAIGLEAAHKKSIVHRDIKPDNIIIDKTDKVKVTDFGLAKNLSGGQDQSIVTKQIIGTPAYISPEQIKGTATDPRSDLYSLGATLYHCLVGKPPFTARNPFELLEKHLKEKPAAPHTVKEEVSTGISDVVVKCLAKDLKNRYQSAAELIADLDRVESGVKVATTSSFHQLSQRWPVRLGAAAFVVAAIAWLGFQFTSGGDLEANPVIVSGSNGGMGPVDPSTPVPGVDPVQAELMKFREQIRDAEAYEERGELEFALERYRGALQIRPEDETVQSRVEDLEKRLEDRARVKAAEEELKNLRSAAMEAFGDLQVGLEPTAEKLNEAIRLLQELSEKVPGDGKVRRFLLVAEGWREAREQTPTPPGNGEKPPLFPPIVGDPENGERPPTPFDGTIWVKGAGYLSGRILSITEDEVIIMTAGGEMKLPQRRVESIEAKGTGLRTRPGAGPKALRPVEEFDFQVAKNFLKDGRVVVRYDFNKPEQLLDWELRGAVHNPRERAVSLGPGGTMVFNIRFEGDVRIDVEVWPQARGTFQAGIYNYNVFVAAGGKRPPGVAEEWEIGEASWEGEEVPRLMVKEPNWLTIRRQKKVAFLSVNFEEEFPLEGEIPPGLGRIAFRAEGSGFLIRGVKLTGRPKP